MSKYEKVTNNFRDGEIENILVDGETLIWSGKPKKSVFLLTKCLGMLPIAVVWFCFDFAFLYSIFNSGIVGMWWFFVPFFLIHLMPVWIWIGNVLTANKRWQNTRYIVTDKRIVISSGFIGTEYQTLYYKDIENVNLKIGFLDKLFNVGDIYFIPNGLAFLDVENVYEIYPKIQKIVLDIQTDIEYPNNLRPDRNDGYQTKYNVKF